MSSRATCPALNNDGRDCLSSPPAGDYTISHNCTCPAYPVTIVLLLHQFISSIM